MTLNWEPGQDNVGVDHYNVFLNANKVAETNALSWTYSGLTCGTSYDQGLTVEDAAGNTSNLAEATWGRSTLACDPEPLPPPPPGDIQPGQSWNAAYQNASCGQVFQLGVGNHGVQRILENPILSLCSQPVVFHGGAGVVMAEVQFGHCQGCFATNAADKVAVQGPLKLTGGVSCIGDCRDITIDGVDGGGIVLDSLGNAGGPQNWLIKNSDWGPCWSSGPNFATNCNAWYNMNARHIEIGAGCCPGSDGPSLSNIQFVGNTIHDFKLVTVGDHYECVRTSGGSNYTWRNNKFWGCEIYALVTTHWGGTNHIENNWFGGADDVFGGGRALGIGWEATGSIFVRFNSFSSADGITNDSANNPTPGVYHIIGNLIGNTQIFGTQCWPGTIYAYNIYVGPKCGDSTNVGNTPLQYVNPVRGPNMNYHLAASPWLADNRVPGSAPNSDLATDFDGQARIAPRDAGSDER
jgi:hypothetical protein